MPQVWREPTLLPCNQCGEIFKPSASQRRLAAGHNPIYCSVACADAYVLEANFAAKCRHCQRQFVVRWADGFYDYIWDAEKNNFCSLDCLYAHLINHQQISLPPVPAARVRSLALLTASDEISDRAVGTTPQLNLFNRVAEVFAGRWELEYSVATGLYQRDKRKLYRIDIAHPQLKIAIECDGLSHRRRAAQVSDAVRDMALAQHGWVTLRFPYYRIKHDMSGCLEAVAEAIAHQERKKQEEGKQKL